jgi:hypothetical protein
MASGAECFSEWIYIVSPSLLDLDLKSYTITSCLVEDITGASLSHIKRAQVEEHDFDSRREVQ